MLVPVLPLLLISFALDPNLAAAQASQRAGDLPAARRGYELVLKNSRAAGLSGLAQVDLALGHYADAILEATEAADLFTAQSNRSERAQMLTTSGIARFYSGDSRGALRDFERGLALARDMHDHDAEVARLNNIGNIYYAEGRYGDAMREYEEAQAKSPSVSAARRQLTLANIAGLYQRMGQYSRALNLYRDLSGQTDLPPRERAQMLSNMGTLYRRMGDPVTALETYRSAQALYRDQREQAGEIGVLNNIGIAQALYPGRAEDAIATFTAALHLAETSGGRQLAMSTLLYRGEAYLRLNDLAAAEQDFNEAHSLAGELHAEEERWRAAYGLARVADLRHDFAVSNTLLEEAVNIIEKMRQAAAASGGGRSGFLIERRDVYDLLIRHENSPASVFRLMEQSRARDLRDRLHVTPLSLDDLRRRLPKNALLLEYWIADDSVAVVWATSARAGYVRHASGDLNNFDLALSDPSRKDWKAVAARAATTLFAGVDAVHDPALQHVVVIPDGDLSRVPFESLPVDDRTLLIDRAAVSYLPLAAMFDSTSMRRRVVFPWMDLLIGFADPSATSELPAAVGELANVARIVGGRAVVHAGSAAQKLYLNQSAPFLHLATHAFADPEDPARSYILFAPPTGLKGDDYLYLKEVANLAAHFDLVTISACESGTGKFVRGEGAQSFASAFIATGTHAVVTSLWRTGDRPSAELMQRFYLAMAQGDDAAQALRAAKLGFRHSGTSASHPAYWAGFVLTGDARMPLVISWWMLAAGLFLVCALVLAAFRMWAGKA